MATFKYLIKGKLRSDNTYLISIRITHNRKYALVSTGIYVSAQEVTKGLKIKNKLVVAKCEDMINDYRKKLLQYDTLSLSLEDIVNIIKSGNVFSLDFIEYSRRRISKMKGGTQRSYLGAIAWLIKTTGEQLPIEKFTKQIVIAVSEDLLNSGLKRAPSLYMQCLKNLFNMARDEFNGEYADEWVIRHNPFFKFDMPKERIVESRALSLDQIRAIVDTPYGQSKVINIAKDVFILSLGLLGINSADLYSATNIKAGVITYNREKTKGKRQDEAMMKVNIPHQLEDLVKKHKGKDRVFNFSERHEKAHSFNMSINRGLKIIQKEANKILIERQQETIDKDLTYYYARHTVATLCQDYLGYDKYFIGELLNHSLEGSLRTTNRYTKKNWQRVFEANNAIVQLIFGDATYNCKEEDSLTSRSSTGHKGIYLYNGVYAIRATVNGKSVSVGSAKTLDKAVKKLEEFKKKH